MHILQLISKFITNIFSLHKILISSNFNVLFKFANSNNLTQSAPKSGVSNMRPTSGSNASLEHVEKLRFLLCKDILPASSIERYLQGNLKLIFFTILMRNLVSSLMQPPSPFEFETPGLKQMSQCFIRLSQKISFQKSNLYRDLFACLSWNTFALPLSHILQTVNANSLGKC